MTEQVLKHNHTTLQELEVGDMIEFRRGIYSHWGVYVGDEEIVHLTGDENDGINGNVNSGHIFTICGTSFNKAFVKKDNFWDVVLDSKAYKNNGKDKKFQPREPSLIKKSALELLGEIGYNVLWNNCEHFAALCRYGEKKSEQVETFAKWVMGMGAAVMLGALALGGMKGKEKKEDKEDR